MPSGVRSRARQQRLQNAVTGVNSLYWECPHCTRLILDMRGGRARHENKCTQRLQALDMPRNEIPSIPVHQPPEPRQSLSPIPLDPPVPAEANYLEEPSGSEPRQSRSAFRKPWVEEVPDRDSGTYLIRHQSIVLFVSWLNHSWL